MNLYALVMLVLFVALMIGIGFWGMKKTSSLNDFFLGGRTLGPWISAFAYGTSYFSAVVFIGFAGKLGWGFGLNVMLIALGNVVFGSFLAWLVLGRRTRRMTQNLDVMTMPEFLQDRFDAKYIKLITASIIFIFLLPYSASVFKGLGHLFEISFHIPYDVALLIMIGITGIYLVMGGYFAISLNDFIQGMIMLLGCAAMIAVLVSKGGGFAETIATIQAKYPVHVPPARQPGWLLLFSLVFMTSFGTWGLPQMVQKFYAIKDEKTIMRAAVVTSLFAIIVVGTAYFTGAMSHVFTDTLPMTNNVPDFDKLIPNLLVAHLPDALMGLIILLVLSASMSTLSSLILVSSSSVAIDMYKGHVNPQISKENSVAMMRFLCLLFIAISFFIARYQFALIVTLMSLSWGAVAGSFMAPYLYALYWKRTTRYGAAAGMITGLSLSIILFFVLGPAMSPVASTIAMIVPFAVVPLVSLFTSKPADSLIEKAFDGI